MQSGRLWVGRFLLAASMRTVCRTRALADLIGRAGRLFFLLAVELVIRTWWFEASGLVLEDAQAQFAMSIAEIYLL